MTESMPPTLAQLQQLNRGLTEKVLDKAQSDPAWKQLLLDDPEAALWQANFPETQQLEQMRASAAAQQGEEVRGQYGGDTLWSTRGSNPDYSLSLPRCHYQCQQLTWNWAWTVQGGW
jgi:hypothetical protein